MSKLSRNSAIREAADWIYRLGEPDASEQSLIEWQRWLGAEPRGYTFVALLHKDVIARDMMTEGQRQRILERLP